MKIPCRNCRKEAAAKAAQAAKDGEKAEDPGAEMMRALMVYLPVKRPSKTSWQNRTWC